MQRVVVDTSTLIGAVLRRGSLPRQAFQTVIHRYELCASPATLEELGRVLQRPKFDAHASLEERGEFHRLVIRHSRLCEVDGASEQAASGACRDAKDEKFLALALACQASVLISSDSDLLVLHPWRGVQILTPGAFVALAQT